MSALPEGWADAGLLDVADSLDSMRVPVNRTEREKRPGQVPYYGATGQVGWIDEALFDEDLVLVGEDGAPFLDRTKPKAYTISGPSWVNNHAHVLRAVAGATTNRFLKYYLDWVDYRQHVNGTTRLKLTKGAMSNMPLPLPPLNEQRRIVAAIEEQFSRLDAADESLRRAHARLDGLEIAAYRASLEGDWSSQPLSSVAEVRLGRQRSPKNHVGPNMRPYLRAANVTWGGLNLSDVKEMHFTPDEVSTYRLEPGDLLVAEASGSQSEVGKTAIWRGQIVDCCFQNTLLRVRSTGDLSPQFLAVVLQHSARSGAFGRASPGVGIHHLGATRLSAWPVPVPPPEKQGRIVAEVEQRLSMVESMRDTIEVATRRSISLRRSILERAFRGELVAQDPADEPASALLERIRTERAVAAPAPRRRRVSA